MRYWRIGVWLLIVLATVAVSLFGDVLLGQNRMYGMIAILVFASIFFLATLIADKASRRDIDKEMAAVDKVMRRRE